MDLNVYHCFITTAVTLIVINFAAGVSDLCEDAPESCDCFQNRRSLSIQIQCPASNGSDVKVQYQIDTKLTIDCFNPNYDLDAINLKMMKIETLELNKCRNATLFFGKLKENTRLKTMTIKQASLKNVDVEVLYKDISGAPIETIVLDNNELEEFPQILGDLPGLQRLQLSNNLIRALDKRIHAPNLAALFLINNNIDYVDSEVFQNATKLLYIDLSKNKITKLPAKLLHPLPKLKVLILNSNNFKAIPNGFFEKNTLLLDVRLSNGSLTEIAAYVFSKFTQLKKLVLANNLLRTLPQNVFANLSQLNYLEIGNNLIEDLPESTFRSLKKLKYLFLFHNKLAAWSQSYNEDLASLEELHLNSNNLSGIGASTFAGLPKLKKLDLRRNRISEIHPEAFHNLKELNKLDLSSNNLTKIDDVMEVLVEGIKRKMSVDVSYNHVSHIKVPANFGSALLSERRARSTLIFKQNNFACDCTNYEFIRFLQSSIRESKLRTSGNEECASPLALRGVKLTDLNLMNFTCFDGCPSKCACKIDPDFNTLSLDCSDGNFTKSPWIPRLTRTTLDGNVAIVPEKVQVDLRNNRIEEFTRDSSYENVTVLNLSNNKLVRIDWIPPQIEVLNLDNNAIIGFDSNAVRLLNDSATLMLLTLDNNPWKCDCKVMELVNALRTTLVRTLANVTISCADGFPLLDLYEEKACNKNSTFLIVLIVLLLLTVFVSIILVILYFRYEDYVKIRLYNCKPLLFLIRTSDDFDPDKTYDAFISYSHEDEEFVAKCLVPELENGPEKYKLCLHARDWIVGEYIPKQIADSVRNSRRTIIVLSRNFLSSDWANMEFRTAHDLSMAEERSRLIIILYENVDLKEINNEELRTYLTTNTYIKWGDPWFWKKLRNTMPSSRNYHQKKSELEKTNDKEKGLGT